MILRGELLHRARDLMEYSWGPERHRDSTGKLPTEGYRALKLSCWRTKHETGSSRWHGIPVKR